MAPRIGFLFFFIGKAVFAQAPFTVSVQFPQPGFHSADSETITLNADAVGRVTTAALRLAYRGNTSVQIRGVALSGPSDFSIETVQTPVSLNPGETLGLTVRFVPRTGSRLAGRIAIDFAEGAQTGTLGLNLVGTVPEFVYNVIPQPEGNARHLEPGGAILYPPTVVEAVSSVITVVTNRGSGAGVLAGVTVSGAAFQPASLPVLPLILQPAQEARFSIRFVPKERTTVRGSLELAVRGANVAFSLEGTGIGPIFRYETVRGSTIAPLMPGQQVSFPAAAVGETISVGIVVRNAGNADGRILGVTVLGTGYQLGDLPFLPLTLPPGESTTFRITLAPPQPGRVFGRLRVGDDVFDLAGDGLGPLWTYSVVRGSAVTPIPVAQGAGTVILNPTAVGETASARFVIANTGTADAIVNSVGITGASTVFRLANLPQLPANISPGSRIQFEVAFTPNNVGLLSATLRVDALVFTLSGIGNSPLPLPAYSLQGPSVAVDPLEQHTVSLSLSRPYPLALAGTLTLDFHSDGLAADPALQFASGGRTAAFTIPAHTTQATFAGNATQIRFQSGSVAGDIAITPSFRTEAGLEMSAESGESLVLNLPRAAPRLLQVQPGASRQNGIAVVVSGLSTGRVVRQMEVFFTVAPGVSLAVNRFTMNAEAPFSSWYRTPQSMQFGSLFSAEITFDLQGQSPAAADLSRAIQSITITASNEHGTSDPLSLQLR